MQHDCYDERVLLVGCICYLLLQPFNNWVAVMFTVHIIRLLLNCLIAVLIVPDKIARILLFCTSLSI